MLLMCVSRGGARASPLKVACENGLEKQVTVVLVAMYY